MWCDAFQLPSLLTRTDTSGIPYVIRAGRGVTDGIFQQNVGTTFCNLGCPSVYVQSIDCIGGRNCCRRVGMGALQDRESEASCNDPVAGLAQEVTLYTAVPWRWELPACTCVWRVDSNYKLVVAGLLGQRGLLL